MGNDVVIENPMPEELKSLIFIMLVVKYALRKISR